jgi:hypothetical protein
LVGEVASERRRRSSGGAPAGTRTVAREEVMLNNALPRELPCGLGKTPGRSPGAEDRRRGELGRGGPVAAAGTRALAIVRLVLINKRLGELLGCTRKSLSAHGSGGVDWREMHTGGANGGTAMARGECACVREDDKGWLISAREVGWGRWAHAGATCTRGRVAVMAGDVRRSGGQWRATGGAPAGGSAPPGAAHLPRTTRVSSRWR